MGAGRAGSGPHLNVGPHLKLVLPLVHRHAVGAQAQAALLDARRRRHAHLRWVQRRDANGAPGGQAQASKGNTTRLSASSHAMAHMCKHARPQHKAPGQPTRQALAGAAGQHDDAAARAPVAKHFGQRLFLVRPVLQSRGPEGGVARGAEAWLASPTGAVPMPGAGRQPVNTTCSHASTAPAAGFCPDGSAQAQAALLPPLPACTLGLRSMARSGLCVSFLKSYSSSMG